MISNISSSNTSNNFTGNVSSNIFTNEYCDSTMKLTTINLPTMLYINNSVLKSTQAISKGEVFYVHDIKDTHLHLGQYMYVDPESNKLKNITAIRQCSDMYLLYESNCTFKCTIAYIALLNIDIDDELVL